MSFLLERFTLSLLDNKDSGLVIFDKVNRDLENKLRTKFYKYIREETITFHYGTRPVAEFKNHIYPSILFADDHHSTLIQAVDLVATPLNSALVSALKGGKRVVVADLPERNQFLKIYWPLFSKSPGGDVDGWGVKIWY